MNTHTFTCCNDKMKSSERTLAKELCRNYANCVTEMGRIRYLSHTSSYVKVVRENEEDCVS